MQRKKIFPHELIGLEIEIVESTHKPDQGVKGKIIDEYGQELKPDEMITLITERGEDIDGGAKKWKEHNPYGYNTWAEFHEANHSVPGPRGLLRHKQKKDEVWHGCGTWDCISRDFF